MGGYACAETGFVMIKTGLVIIRWPFLNAISEDEENFWVGICVLSCLSNDRIIMFSLNRTRRLLKFKKSRLAPRRTPLELRLDPREMVVPVLGQKCKVLAEAEGQRMPGCYLADAVLRVNFSTLPHPALIVAETGLELALWFKRQAVQYFRERADFWARQAGVSYRQIIVVNPEKRWGSCNHCDDIRLSWRLMFLPPDIIDYVIAHEICHVKQKNHAPVFWAEVAKIIPDWKQKRLILREWERELMKSGL